MAGPDGPAGRDRLRSNPRARGSGRQSTARIISETDTPRERALQQTNEPDQLAYPFPEPARDVLSPAVKAGLRACLPTGVASGLVAISYGVLARPVLGAVPTVVSSLIIFAGSAQFAMLAVLSAGGGATAAVLAGTLLNLRFVPMGLALAPWVRGGRLRRAATGWIMVDASWAMAAREGGRFDVPFMLGGSLANYPAWVGGTLIGVLAGSTIGNPRSLGLDALFPAFFLALLLEEIRGSRRRVVVALAGGLIALALTPIAPAGIPVLAAGAAALLGLRGQ